MNLKLFSVGITSIKLRPNSQNKAGLLCTRRQLNEHRIKLITACCLLASQLLHSLVARSPRVKKNKCLKQTNGKTHWVWSHPVCSKRVHKRPSRHVFCTDINEQIMSTVGKHHNKIFPATLLLLLLYLYMDHDTMCYSRHSRSWTSHLLVLCICSVRLTDWSPLPGQW